MTKKTQNKDLMIALLQVRNQLQAIRSFMETMIDDVIQRGVEKLFVASIRITTDKDNYSFSVGYYPKNNYVKVFYKRNKTPFDFFGDALVDNWIKISDHDSCWRDSWHFTRELMIEIENNFKKDDYVYITVEKVKIFNVVEYTTAHQKERGFAQFSFKIDTEFGNTGNAKINQIEGK